MTTARIIEAVGSLLWPLLVAVVVFRIVPHVPAVVAELRRAIRARTFTVRVGDAELSVEQATEQLRRQVTDLQTHLAGQLAEQGPVGASEVVTGVVTDQGRPTVLWVDDDPRARTLEIAKLRDDGVEVLQARSTAEAIDVLTLRRGVQAIVTDLGRTEGGEFRSHAGLALLRRLREAELEQPVVVYASARGVALDRQDALDAGAAVVTASPTELFAGLRRVLAEQPVAPDPSSAGPGLARPRRRPTRPETAS
jgi:CheY-like chemotaxis protein